MNTLMNVWKSRASQLIAASLLNITIMVVLLTTVPGWKEWDLPWNIYATGSTGLAFFLLAPSLIKQEKKKDE